LIGETITFAALMFWIVAFTMSRESQRLERRLGVGTR
jgi:ABC-type amino acid transport system permease subunit